MFEEFKSFVPHDIKVDEQQVSVIHDAAVKADDYSLTPKSMFESVLRKTQATGSTSHTTVTQDHTKTKTNVELYKTKNAKFCKYCKMNGHVGDCTTLKRQSEREGKLMMLVSCVSPSVESINNLLEPEY